LHAYFPNSENPLILVESVSKLKLILKKLNHRLPQQIELSKHSVTSILWRMYNHHTLVIDIIGWLCFVFATNWVGNLWDDTNYSIPQLDQYQFLAAQTDYHQMHTHHHQQIYRLYATVQQQLPLCGYPIRKIHKLGLVHHR